MSRVFDESCYAGRVAAITGGASGIGEAAARAFARHGATVVILDRDGERAGRIRGELVGARLRARSLTVDVTDERAVKAALNDVVAELGRLDVLHVNAGMEFVRRVAETSSEDWRRVVDVNLTGAFVATREVLPLMARGGGGSIVFTASTLALLGAAETAAYSASKAGILALMRVLAIEAAPLRVRVNAVLPGGTDTPMLRREAELAPDPAAQLERFARIHPLGRLARAEEVAAGVLFLASDAASFVTGTALAVDGGLTAVQSAGPALTYTS